MQEALIYWPIHTLDRTKANPFPLEVREWRLDWSLVPELEKREILHILAPELLSQKVEGKIPEEGDQEAHLSFARPDFRILKFRKYFIREENFDIKKPTERLGKDLWHLIPVNLHEYFEDETGSEISKIEIYRFKTGESNPVIPFDPLSVINLGPTPPNPAMLPSQSDSDTLAHFLEITQFIAKSSWYNSPPALTYRTEGGKAELESLFPNAREMNEVVLGIRQLYAVKDDLFNKAINCYLRACGENKKAKWVEQIKDKFYRFLTGSNSFPSVKDLSVRALLDAFLYGAGIAHVHIQSKQERLQELIAKHKRANVMMMVQSSFRQLVDLARTVSPVLAQDYYFWISTGQCPKPSQLSVAELLSSKKEQIESPKGKQK